MSLSGRLVSPLEGTCLCDGILSIWYFQGMMSWGGHFRYDMSRNFLWTMFVWGRSRVSQGAVTRLRSSAIEDRLANGKSLLVLAVVVWYTQDGHLAQGLHARCWLIIRHSHRVAKRYKARRKVPRVQIMHLRFSIYPSCLLLVFVRLYTAKSQFSIQ